MDVIVVDSAEQSAEIGADLVVETFRARPEGVIGLATGSSPQFLYRALGARVRDGADFSRLSAFALDEYIGIPLGNPESYHSIIYRDAFGPLGLDAARVHIPDEVADDNAAAAYENAIRSAGGIDIQDRRRGHAAIAQGNVNRREPQVALRLITGPVADSVRGVFRCELWFHLRDLLPEPG